MSRLAAGGAFALGMILALGGASSASARESVEVIEGERIRIESTADWDRMRDMRPYEPVVWTLDIEVPSGEGVDLDIGVVSEGDLPMLVDASVCSEAWQGDDCRADREDLRSAWSLVHGEATEWIHRAESTDRVHVRLGVWIEEGASGTADVAVHVHGAMEDIVVDGHDELTPTDAEALALPFAIAALLLGIGAMLAGRGGKRRTEE